MKFETGVYELKIDVERTKAWYEDSENQGCDCADCRNYRLAIGHLAQPVREFLNRFGVDPFKPYDMTIYQEPVGGRVCYEGFFHIFGKILKGTQPFTETDPEHPALNPDYRICVDEESEAYFVRDVMIFDEEDDAIALNISFMLPWLLDEPEPKR